MVLSEIYSITFNLHCANVPGGNNDHLPARVAPIPQGWPRESAACRDSNRGRIDYGHRFDSCLRGGDSLRLDGPDRAAQLQTGLLKLPPPRMGIERCTAGSRMRYPGL